MKTPSEIYPPFKVDVPMTDDETAFEDIEDDDAPGSSNDPHQSIPKSLNGMLNLGLINRRSHKLALQINALSFYVTKTVLVSPKWFWSDQIDLDLTIMIWS